MTPFPPFLPKKKTSPNNYDYDDVTEFFNRKKFIMFMNFVYRKEIKTSVCKYM